MDKINSNLSSDECIPAFEPDGKFHHYKRGVKSPSSSHVWAIAWEWEYNGKNYEYAKVGDWRTGATFVERSYNPSNETTRSKTFARKQITALEETIAEEREEKHETCVNKWKPIFESCFSSDNLHDYLALKKITSNFCGRISGDNLLVPIYHPDHDFVGVQQVFKKDGKYHKFFSKGIRIKGSFTKINDFDIANTSLLYLTEGFATGCSVHMATKKPTVAAFNCHNLIPTIASIRLINPSVKIIIAADDDHDNPKNPGKFAAVKAAKQFSNVIYRLPNFENNDGLTDFNDLHVNETLDVVTDQLNTNNADFISIIPLGHKDANYFYINTQTNEVFSWPPAQHVQNNFLSQAPAKYWGQKFGYKTDSTQPDWALVSEKLFVEQRAAGFFEHENIRGIGAWIDKNKMVYNTGKHLLIDGVLQPIGEHSLQTSYLYQATKDIGLDLNSPLSQESCHKIIECFQGAKYSYPSDYIYLVGWLVLAQIPGALDWRSHIWLTGSRGTGKTTLLNWISELCFNNGLGIIQDPTAAGLRQAVGSQALPIFIDEAEPTNNEARRRLSQVMSLIRQSSSRIQSKIVRGTSDGSAQSFLVSGIFMLSSIQQALDNAADVSRFKVIEIEKNDPVKFRHMQSIASNFPDWAPRLQTRVLLNHKVILKNQSIIRDMLFEYSTQLDARQADQLSYMVAGYWEMMYGGELDDVIHSVLKSLNLDSSDYVEDNKATDDDACLNAILGVLGPNRMTVSHMLKTRMNSSDCARDLDYFGIKVIKQLSSKYEIFITAGATSLKSALRETEFYDYAKILRRSPLTIDKRATQRIGGRPRKGFILSVDLAN